MAQAPVQAKATTTTIAEAHPNIALVKYWGKQNRPGNYPATPSLSITLDTLTTRTEVNDATGGDEFFLNDEPKKDTKVTACLAALRTRYDIPPLCIRSANDLQASAWRGKARPTEPHGFSWEGGRVVLCQTSIDALGCTPGRP